jgi:membrane associated rhomboid family serine protease
MSYNDPYRPSGFGYLPVVTKNILIINVLLFILTQILRQTSNIDLNKILSLHYYSAPDFRPHQFITYLFMHADIFHIAFNMLAVFLFGQVLEMHWGPKRFLIFYIVTGLGAAFTQYVIMYFEINPFINELNAVNETLTLKSFLSFVNSPSFQSRLSAETYFEYNSFGAKFNSLMNENPERALSMASQFLIDFKAGYLNSNKILGASGSLFGLLGAFGMLFPNRMIYVYFMVPVKAKWLVIGYGVMELISGIRNSADDNVAHFAHLGGLFVGIVIVLIWRRDRTHFY